MKTIILAGGLGSRIPEYTKQVPKPMIQIGSLPMLSHIMRIFKSYGYDNFIIAAGYKIKVIEKYYQNSKEFKNIKIVNTGNATMTGGRILKLKKFFKKDENFFMTYGDGLSDVNLNKLETFHKKHKKIATVTAVHPPVRFGELKIKNTKVIKFDEKPDSRSSWINGGFFILNYRVFNYIKNDKTVFEKFPLEMLSKNNHLMAYKHEGFWKCMDNMGDKNFLDKMFKNKKKNTMDKIKKFYKNKKILITGVTGFKGSWLCNWLLELGARVYGTGYTPNQNKNLFYDLQLNNKIDLKIIDIRNYQKLKKYINKVKPSIIFHLAAQPLVIQSYKKPIDTFSINVNGTINILDIVSKSNFVKSFIGVTSDKCYENIGGKKSYSENDKLGGTDPYSASKAAAELVINSYYKSFIKKKNCGVSSVRAGNVIGGGDWSLNRLIPDIVQSLSNNKKIFLRNPNFTRPWQHVLEPLKGYLILAKKQFENPTKYSGAWNFGSNPNSIVSVKKVTDLFIKFWGQGTIKMGKKIFKEQKFLQISSNKAKKNLYWKPNFNITKAIQKTCEWYFLVEKKKFDPIDITKKQILEYMNYANKL